MGKLHFLRTGVRANMLAVTGFRDAMGRPLSAYEPDDDVELLGLYREECKRRAKLAPSTKMKAHWKAMAEKTYEGEP